MTSSEDDDVDYYEVFFQDGWMLALQIFTIVISLLGLALNGLLIAITIFVFGRSRYQNALWTNLSVCLLTRDLYHLFDAGTWNIDSLREGSLRCKLDYGLVVSLYVATFGSYKVLLLERIYVLHLPVFYSFYPNMSTFNVVFSWVEALFFLSLVAADVYPTLDVSRCVGPFRVEVHKESITLMYFCLIVLIWLLAAAGNLYILPNVKMDTMSAATLKVEVRNTKIVLHLGLGILLCWLPYQVVSILYWIQSLLGYKFQIYATLTQGVTRFATFVPFLVILQRREFRESVKAMFSSRDFTSIQRRLKTQESYVTTARKVAKEERMPTIEVKKHPYQPTLPPPKAREFIQIVQSDETDQDLRRTRSTEVW